MSDDWEVAGDLLHHNTRFDHDTPDWQRAQTAVLAGIQYGREQELIQAAKLRQNLEATRAELERADALLGAAEAEIADLRETITGLIMAAGAARDGLNEYQAMIGRTGCQPWIDADALMDRLEAAIRKGDAALGTPLRPKGEGE